MKNPAFVLWVKDEKIGYRQVAQGHMPQRRAGDAIVWRTRLFVCNPNSVRPGTAAYDYYELAMLSVSDDELQLMPATVKGG